VSLYNNVAKSLASNGLMGSIGAQVESYSGTMGAKVTEAMGGGRLASRVAGMGANMASNAAMGLVNKHIPIQARNALGVGSRAAGDIMNGDMEGAGMRLLDSGLLNNLFPGMSGVASQSRYWGTPTPLFGGISPTEAKRIYGEIRGQRLAKKNLFLLEVSSHLGGDVSQRANMFATEVEYAPFTVSGEKRKVGGAVLDGVVGNEPVELRITTLDDDAGTIKRWYAKHHAAVAAEDGTVGVPGQYAIKIKIVHAFITRASGPGAYEDIGWYRPANLEVSLSRREDGLQEVQMTFAQLDTFMKA
jgi:hypothetical protein